VSDLKVGYNLHDHLIMPLYVSLEFPVSLTLAKVQQLHQLWDYMIHGKGKMLFNFCQLIQHISPPYTQAVKHSIKVP
jgi:hypothetical protein